MTLAFPDRPEAITPAWMGAALRASLPGVEVAGVEVLDRHSGTTGRARMRVAYASGSAGPETVFVKLPPFGEEQRGLVAATDMGRREARFYAELSAEVPVRVPRCWFAAHGEKPTDYLCVLEDLQASGCRFPKKVKCTTGRRLPTLLWRRFWKACSSTALMNRCRGSGSFGTSG